MSPSKPLETHSLDCRLSLDDQYVEVMSPVRKANSMRVHSRVTRQSADSDTPELDYQNMLPGMGIGEWGDGNESTTAGNLLAVNSSQSHDAIKSPTARHTDQSRAESKSPCA